MSFSIEVKKELSLLKSNQKSSAAAEQFGFLNFSYNEKTSGTKIEFTVSDIKKENVADVLRGAFLACGNIESPEISYHLEFCPQNLSRALDLIALIESVREFDFSPKATRRKKNPVVYLKDSEKIIKFLLFLGAKNSAIKLAKIKTVKEVRNYVNRSTNFETANISKTASSSAKQMSAIKKIRKAGKFMELPEKLKEIANLRLAYPELSLLELARKCNPKISKGGANHRFEKILKKSLEF